MTSEINRGDESLSMTVSGVTTVYDFRFPEAGAALGFSSANAFPAKLVTGDRSYNQSDVFSYYAMSDMSGGMGQDRGIDPTRYYTTYNADARSGRLIPGPLVNMSTADPSRGAVVITDNWGGGVHVDAQWTMIGTPNTKWAVKLITTGAQKMDRVWLPLKASLASGTITVKIYDTSGGLPNTAIATTTIGRDQLRSWGAWAMAAFSTQISLSAATTYWISVEHSAADAVYWRTGTGLLTPDYGAYYDGSWHADSTKYPAYWTADPTVKPDAPLRYRVGYGEDEVKRLWGFGDTSRYLYYFGAAGTATPLVHGSLVPTSVKHFVPAATYTTLTNTFDDNSATVTAFNYVLNDIIYVCSPVNTATQIAVIVGVVNDQAATTTVNVWNGSSWAAVSNLVDGTASGGKPLAQNGSLAHDAPATWASSTVDGVTGYWYQIIYSASLKGATEIAEVQVYDPAGLRTDADINDILFFEGTNDTHPWLYVACWDNNDMLKADANIGSEQTRTVTNIKARRLCVHDDILWRAYDSNKVAGSLTGNTYGNAVAVGDESVGIKRMISWNGGLYVGKDDGLYLISFTSGSYPTSGVPTCNRLIDFSAQTDMANFAMMVEHQGDLFFNVGQSIMRYTTGGVLASITPDSGLDLPTSERTIYRAGVSTLAALWVVAEGSLLGPSSLLAYIEGKWHAIVTATRSGDLMRGLAVDSGLYGDCPRLWYGHGLQVAYVQMPTSTQRRYEWSGLDYASSGYLLTSWIDGNIRTIDKDWIEVQVDARIAAENGGSVTVYWRKNEATSWAQLGNAITTDGISTVSFPTGSYSSKCQLKMLVTKGSADFPQVEAIVVRYLERPADLQAFTRTYELSDYKTWRNGQEIWSRVANQIAALATLRAAKEPLTWRSWWGTTYSVHITQYNATEIITETNAMGDRGHVLVTLTLQRV